MTASLSMYQSAEKYIFDGTIQLYTDTFKLVLCGSGYTPDFNNHTILADLTSEVAAQGGYTTGGWAVGVFTITRSGATTTVDLADLVKTATGASILAWRHAVVYANVTRNTVVNPLLFEVLGDTTPADIPATAINTNLVFEWNVNGIWQS